MASNLLAFRLSRPIGAVDVTGEEAVWRGTDRAQAGCWCTTVGHFGECNPRYEGSSMTCTEWGWGTLECYCAP